MPRCSAPRRADQLTPARTRVGLSRGARGCGRPRRHQHHSISTARGWAGAGRSGGSSAEEGAGMPPSDGSSGGSSGGTAGPTGTRHGLPARRFPDPVPDEVGCQVCCPDPATASTSGRIRTRTRGRPRRLDRPTLAGVDGGTNDTLMIHSWPSRSVADAPENARGLRRTTRRQSAPRHAP